jgi:hypothetical protein
MNPTGDEAGSVLLVNGTMIPVSEAAAPPPPPPPPAPVPATPATTEEPQ